MTTRKEHLENLHNHLNYYNKMSPFPIYDTEYVDKVNETINKLNSTKEDYDSEPVVACTVCNSLHITMEDIEYGEPVDVCNRCYSVGETKEFKDIYEYNDYLKKYEESED